MNNRTIKLCLLIACIQVCLVGCGETNDIDGNESSVQPTTFNSIFDSIDTASDTEVIDSEKEACTDSDATMHLKYMPLDEEPSLSQYDTIFWRAIETVRETAYGYCNSIDEANLLLCQYYRVKRDKFTTRSWNMLAGYPDYDYIALVDSNDKAGLLEELSAQNYLVEPVGGECIELTHFFASLNILIGHRQRRLAEGNSAMNVYVYDMGTWAGDCLELAADILTLLDEQTILDMTDDELEDFALEQIGRSGHFNRNNMLADVDTFNITADMTVNSTDLLELIQSYYLKLHDEEHGSYRFELFLANRYGADTSTEERVVETEKVLLSDNNIYIPGLRKSLSLDIGNKAHVRAVRAVAKAFVSYIEEQ